jgi:hypothetical protein
MQFIPPMTTASMAAGGQAGRPIPSHFRGLCEGWVKAQRLKPLLNTRKRQILNSKERIHPQMLKDFTMITITMKEYRK